MRDRLSDWTTFGIGGRAKRITVARTRAELIDNAPFGLVLGYGSNVLVSDDGYDRSVTVNRYSDVELRGDTVTVGSGAALPKLCGMLASEGLAGLEWAVGIPGSVGGAVRMNAGAFGGAVSDRILYADVLRGGRIVRLDGSQLGFSYRRSNITENDTVVDVAFKLDRQSAAQVKARCAEYCAVRAQKQPSGRSAGSVFKNPNGVSVGKIIDEAGLKGLRIGGAEISRKHGNIIVNVGGATARDVCGLIAVMKDALAERGVAAQEEIKYIGGFRNGVLGRLPHSYDIQPKGQ